MRWLTVVKRFDPKGVKTPARTEQRRSYRLLGGLLPDLDAWTRKTRRRLPRRVWLYQGEGYARIAA